MPVLIAVNLLAFLLALFGIAFVLFALGIKSGAIRVQAECNCPPRPKPDYSDLDFTTLDEVTP